MKIRKVIPEEQNKVYGLFRKGFPGSTVQLNSLQKLHRNNKILHEWVCIHTNKNIAYIAFSNAYDDSKVCGLHLLYLLVKPEFQRQGIGTELLQFALRQQELQDVAVYALGDRNFYERFGFELCQNQRSKFSGKKRKLLSLGNTTASPFTVTYDPEYKPG